MIEVLLYLLTLGNSAQSIAKQALRQGRKIPDGIANAPELQIGLQLYLQAFFDLDSERSHAFGVTRIPGSAVRQYAVDWELDEQQTDDLIFFIKRMDAAHLERLAAKQKAQTGKNK